MTFRCSYLDWQWKGSSILGNKSRCWDFWEWFAAGENNFLMLMRDVSTDKIIAMKEILDLAMLILFHLISPAIIHSSSSISQSVIPAKWRASKKSWSSSWNPPVIFCTFLNNCLITINFNFSTLSRFYHAHYSFELICNFRLEM